MDFLQLEILQIENFLGIDRLEIEIPVCEGQRANPSQLVLLGASGYGKSAVLDAICMLCREEQKIRYQYQRDLVHAGSADLFIRGGFVSKHDGMPAWELVSRTRSSSTTYRSRNVHPPTIVRLGPSDGDLERAAADIRRGMSYSEEEDRKAGRDDMPSEIETFMRVMTRDPEWDFVVDDGVLMVRRTAVRTKALETIPVAALSSEHALLLSYAHAIAFMPRGPAIVLIDRLGDGLHPSIHPHVLGALQTLRGDRASVQWICTTTSTDVLTHFRSNEKVILDNGGRDTPQAHERGE